MRAAPGGGGFGGEVSWEQKKENASAKDLCRGVKKKNKNRHEEGSRLKKNKKKTQKKNGKESEEISRGHEEI